MERRGIFGDRRVMERREERAFRPAPQERRSGDDRRGPDRRYDGLVDRRRRDQDRRHGSLHEPAAGGRRRTDWTTALPPVSRLIPAAVVVVVSFVDLFVAQATSDSAWGFLVVASAIPTAAFALATPSRWRWHLAAVWFAVGLYVMAAAVHIAYLLTR